MSRHHILPALVYVPQPKPKQTENRKRRVQVGDEATFDGMDEAGEAHEATAANRSPPSFVARGPQNFSAIEGSESKPQPPGGRLSESTLKTMLLMQELR